MPYLFFVAFFLHSFVEQSECLVMVVVIQIILHVSHNVFRHSILLQFFRFDVIAQRRPSYPHLIQLIHQ